MIYKCAPVNPSTWCADNEGILTFALKTKTSVDVLGPSALQWDYPGLDEKEASRRQEVKPGE